MTKRKPAPQVKIEIPPDADLTIKIDAHRLEEVRVDDLFGLYEGNPVLIAGFLSTFVLNTKTKKYVDPRVGMSYIRRNYKHRELYELRDAFITQLRDGLVSPTNGSS